MKKRGQLTLFIIVAIVIVIAIISILFLYKSKGSTQENDEYFNSASVRGKVDTLKDYLQDCIDSTTKEALILIPFQGGYYEPPAKSFAYSPVFFPYYYYEGKITIPTIEDIQNNMGDYITDMMTKCVRDNPHTEFKLEQGTTFTNVKITPKNVFFEIDMPIQIRQAGHVMTYNTIDYTLNYNSSLYEMYEVAEYFTITHNEDQEYYCISCVSEMAFERGLYVYLYPQMTDQLITGVMIYENSTGIVDPHTFVFFNKYTGDEKTPKLNY